jgi:hypothetical protein
VSDEMESFGAREEQEQGIRRDLGAKTPPPPGSSTWKPLTITVCVSHPFGCSRSISRALPHTFGTIYTGINYFIDKNAGGVRSMINTLRFPPPLSRDGNVKSQSAP